MAHASQERYSALVDAKLRATLVTRDNTIFNNRYEGSPKAGKVKIPVRDTEVAVKAYDKANGVDADAGTTTYLDLDIDNDEAVNEIIDGFDAASVPDGITAERLDSAGYSMALSIDEKVHRGTAECRGCQHQRHQDRLHCFHRLQGGSGCKAHPEPQRRAAGRPLDDRQPRVSGDPHAGRPLHQAGRSVPAAGADRRSGSDRGLCGVRVQQHGF